MKTVPDILDFLFHFWGVFLNTEVLAKHLWAGSMLTPYTVSTKTSAKLKWDLTYIHFMSASIKG